MAKIDISGLSLQELKSLGNRIEKAIERKKKKQKNEALQALKSTAKEFGFALSDLVEGPEQGKSRGKKRGPKPKKASRAVAYRHPKDASKTWGGRGPRPVWLREAIKSGKKLEDFKVA